MNELALFAGAGGGILGGKLLGWRTVCAVEIDPYARRVLLARQADGCLEPFPIWDDVTTFDGNRWCGSVDVVSGGFPCQDLSVAKQGAEGIDGSRSGLWKQMARIVCEVRPRFVFVENSPALTFRGLGRVLGDLAEMGFDACWGVFSAADVGAPHIRERIWILAYAGSLAEYRPVLAKDCPELGGDKAVRCEDWKQFALVAGVPAGLGRWRELGQPGLVRVDDGVADVLDRLHAVGNGQVPAVVRHAWCHLAAGIPDIGTGEGMNIQGLESNPNAGGQIPPDSGGNLDRLVGASGSPKKS